jgi:FXSXX-COOH protein
MADELLQYDGDLVDLTGIALADLELLDGSALVGSLTRVLTEIEQPDDVVAAFQSAV